MTSHPDLDADQLVELLLAASENGFVTLGDEPGPYSFDCDGDCVHASWDDFFVKYASFLAPGSEFCVMTSDDVLYGYRIDADRKVTFVEGEIVWKELTTVSVSRPLEEIRAACIGRTNPVILNAYRRDVRSTAPQPCGGDRRQPRGVGSHHRRRHRRWQLGAVATRRQRRDPHASPRPPGPRWCPTRRACRCPE